MNHVLTFGRRVQIGIVLALFPLVFAGVWILVALERVWRWPSAWPSTVAELRERQAWTWAQLRKSGVVHEGERLKDYHVEAFRQGEAFRSSLALVTVVVERRGGGERQVRCVAKFAPTEGTIANAAIYVLQSNHVREIGYATKLAAGLGYPAPRALAAHCRPATGSMCVLMEYREGAREISESDGCPKEDAKAALRRMASVHAAGWNLDRAWPERVPDWLIDSLAALPQGAASGNFRGVARGAWRYCNRHLTLIHGDARVGNFLFPGAGSGPELPDLIDWQAVRWGIPAFDVAYFLTLSLRISDRRAWTAELVEVYYQELVARGVSESEYPRSELEEGLHHAVLTTVTLLVLPFLSGEVSAVGETVERAIEGGIIWLARAYAGISDVPEGWFRERFGVDRAEFLRAVSPFVERPHPFHPNAAAVARRIRQRGTLDGLE